MALSVATSIMRSCGSSLGSMMPARLRCLWSGHMAYARLTIRGEEKRCLTCGSTITPLVQTPIEERRAYFRSIGVPERKTLRTSRTGREGWSK